MKKLLLPFGLVCAVGGCALLDQYSDAWRRVGIGDSRDQVVQVMGQPGTQRSIELPLIQLEQMTWRSLGGKVYLMHFAFGRAVTKVVVD